ncbi:MAG: heme oxygenase [Rubritepida sp.]|nr:heme oxygenase [Rubritepida sp.]
MNFTSTEGFPQLLPPAISTRNLLRQATAPLHEAVEARFEGLDLTDAADYGRFLAIHAMSILPLEAALDDAGIAATLPDWHARKRGAALAEDLAALGQPMPEGHTIRLASGAEALGAAYVLEGSRLGAAMLLRQIPEGLPTAFLRHGHKERLWQSFLPHLEGLTAAQTDLAVLGAQRAFGLFLPGAAA